VYPELVKDFWMKVVVITRKVYDEFVQKMVADDPRLENKTPKEMGIRPFLGTEIKSSVAGLKISIRLEHIYEALRIPSNG
jgi:hypothetical protein